MRKGTGFPRTNERLDDGGVQQTHPVEPSPEAEKRQVDFPEAWAAHLMDRGYITPWELYDLRNDWAHSEDMAAKYPDKLKEPQAAPEEKQKLVTPQTAPALPLASQNHGYRNSRTHSLFSLKTDSSAAPLVLSQQVRRCSSSRLVLEIDEYQRLAAIV
jgi:hypothetical protein